jgi:hypothetical protein
MSPVGSQPRPEAWPTHPEPGRTRGALSERERWALVHAAYPLPARRRLPRGRALRRVPRT